MCIYILYIKQTTLKINDTKVIFAQSMIYIMIIYITYIMYTMYTIHT